MVALIILIVCIINLVLTVRLNKCGRIVKVEQKHVYVPATKSQKLVHRNHVVAEQEFADE